MSSGAATGLLKNGRRVYMCGDNTMYYVTIHAMSDSDPVTKLAVWSPDPEAPKERWLPSTSIFHPQFIKHLTTNAPNWRLYRFMDWLETNANTNRDWIDRNLPTHVNFGTVLADRGPYEPKYTSRHTSGAPFEFIAALCNLQQVDCYINIPHMATDEYIRNVARVMRFGSDGVNPYSTEQAAPIWAPLRAQSRLFVEYSNEIWSNGGSFPQGEWAQAQGAALVPPIGYAQFNARRSCRHASFFLC